MRPFAVDRTKEDLLPPLMNSGGGGLFGSSAQPRALRPFWLQHAFSMRRNETVCRKWRLPEMPRFSQMGRKRSASVKGGYPRFDFHGRYPGLVEVKSSRNGVMSPVRSRELKTTRPADVSEIVRLRWRDSAELRFMFHRSWGLYELRIKRKSSRRSRSGPPEWTDYSKRIQISDLRRQHRS